MPKGEYLLKLADLDSEHRVVNVFNADGTRLKAIIRGIPIYRLERTGTTQFSVDNAEGAGPAILRSWFYPGDNAGLEFPETR